jgi:hypothetical protein
MPWAGRQAGRQAGGQAGRRAGGLAGRQASRQAGAGAICAHFDVLEAPEDVDARVGEDDARTRCVFYRELGLAALSGR